MLFIALVYFMNGPGQLISSGWSNIVFPLYLQLFWIKYSSSWSSSSFQYTRQHQRLFKVKITGSPFCRRVTVENMPTKVELMSCEGEVRKWGCVEASKGFYGLTSHLLHSSFIHGLDSGGLRANPSVRPMSHGGGVLPDTNASNTTVLHCIADW